MLELFLTPRVSMLQHFYAVCTGCTKAHLSNPFVLMLDLVQAQVRNLLRYLFTVSDSAAHIWLRQGVKVFMGHSYLQNCAKIELFGCLGSHQCEFLKDLLLFSASH